MKFVRLFFTAVGLGLAGGGTYLILQPPPSEGIVKYTPAAGLLLFAFLTFKVWLPMIKSVDHANLLRDGETAMATIVTVGKSGARINGQPVYKFTLDVASSNGETRRMTTRQIVALTSVGGLRPGLVVPVRIDPGRPDEVAIDSHRVNETFTAGAPSSSPGAGVVRSADVVRDGVRAKATVQTVSLTGKTFGQMRPTDADESTGDDPVVVLGLHVVATDGTTFTAQGVHRTPKHQLSEISPGGLVPVAYLPNDPAGTTCVDWDRL